MIIFLYRVSLDKILFQYYAYLVFILIIIKLNFLVRYDLDKNAKKNNY